MSAETANWVAFLENAIGGLRLAADKLRTKRAEFECKDGWFRKMNKEIPHEESVSSALANMFEIIRADQAISGSGVQPIDLRHISIATEQPRKMDRGIGRKSNPTDYKLVLLKDRELDLRIEAKTVLDDAEIRDEYLGQQGLLRFEDSTNPYTVERFGGMVAYVVDLNAKTWSDRIANAVATLVGNARSSRLKLGADEHQVSCHSVSVGTANGTQHYNIDVVHFVLEIDASPPRR